MVRGGKLHILLIPVLFGLLPACGGGGGGGDGTRERTTVSVDGVDREVWTYTPRDLPAGAPLVLVFHETGGTADDALGASGGVALADAQKLFLMAPQARTLPTGDWDNHAAGQRYFETYPSTAPGSNPDLKLVQAMIAQARGAHGSDPARTYSIGFSNGAFFAAFTAATLPDQIAAFAEASGGLVTCPTTGDCTFSSGSGRSCDELTTQPGYCSCAGDEKPAPLPVDGRKPAGYLSHALDDYTVSVFYSCTLAGRMQQLGYPISMNLRQSGGHSWPSGFASAAWPFLSQHPLR